MAEALEQVCRVIREDGIGLGEVEVGFSKNWTYFQAHKKFSPWDALVAAFAHARTQR
jgi:hypothetical protein